MTTIILPFPPSLNRMYRIAGKRIILTAAARDYKTEIGWTARAASCEPLTGDVAMTVDIYKPRRNRDIDNCLKLTLDGLQGHLYQNDQQVKTLIVHMYNDKKNPHLVVTVTGAIDQGIALSRLRRAATWVETGRAGGYVSLQGVSANGDLRTLDLPESVFAQSRAGRARRVRRVGADTGKSVRTEIAFEGSYTEVLANSGE